VVKNCFFISFFCLPVLLTGGTIVCDIPVEDIIFDISAVSGYDKIGLHNSFSLAEPGHPDLPGLTFYYLLPFDQKLVDVAVVAEQWHSVQGRFTVFPKQREHIVGETVPFTEPDPLVYASDVSCPYSPLISVRSGNMRGFQVAYLCVVPFRYFPGRQELQRLRELTVTIETAAHTEGAQK